MKNLSFVLWMIGFPLVVSIENYLSHLQGNKFSPTIDGIVALIILAIWVFVGTLLYEKKK